MGNMLGVSLSALFFEDDRMLTLVTLRRQVVSNIRLSYWRSQTMGVWVCRLLLASSVRCIDASVLDW